MTQGDGSGDPQEQLTRQLGLALVRAAGSDWLRIEARYRSAGRHVEADLVITGPDGTERTVPPPMAAVALFAKLRGGMYRPGEGTWLSATYLIERSGSFSVDYEPDAEPAWRRVPPPIGFADELRWFPRTPESTPDWLAERAAQAQPPPAPGTR